MCQINKGVKVFAGGLRGTENFMQFSNYQSWAIGTWDRYSGIPVLPEVKSFYRLPKYRPFENSTGYLLPEVGGKKYGYRTEFLVPCPALVIISTVQKHHSPCSIINHLKSF